MPTIGKLLKETRETRGLTIKQVIQATRIRSYYIEAMEADDFSAMPSAAQARGFLRSYAGFLGLDRDEIINRQRIESSAPPEFIAPASTNPPTPAPVAVEPAPTQPELEPVEEPATPGIEDDTPEASAIALEPGLINPQPPETPETPAPQLESQQIFAEIGSKLRQRRELLSLTYEEIERHTRVRKHYLQMIENGDFGELPSPVQARGMLSTYASFLDVDSESILLRFADALQARRLERQSAGPQKSGLPRQRLMLPLLLQRFISPDLIFGGGMILMLFIMVLWFAARILSTQAAETTPTQGPSISDVLLATQATSDDLTSLSPTGVAEIGTPLPEINEEQTTPTETLLPPSPSAAVQIMISVLERTFLRVTVDGEIQQDGRVAPGAALSFDGLERIEILTGSGAALQVTYNQRNLGVMGSFGEVVNRVYTVNGEETPTPTSSPTPSITPPPSRTPRPTLTLRPSSTPRPTSTPRATATARP